MNEEYMLPTDRRIRETRLDARLRIGARWEDSAHHFPVFDPATGQEIGSAPRADGLQVTAAVDAAQAAFEEWRRLAPDVRASYLRRLYDVMSEETDALAALVTAETGKPLTEARGEAAYAAEFALWYAEEARRRYGATLPGGATADARIALLPHPLGVVAAITPWNYPLVLVLRKVGAALAAGCTVVLKPSEETPLSAYVLTMLAERAGVPPGVLNLVTTDEPGRIADALIDDPRVRKISFTGSVTVGKELMANAARTLTRVGLELGGHNPFVVLPDTDVETAAAAAATARLRNGGQTCVAANRVYVHRDIEKNFLDAFVGAMRSRVVGDGFDPTTQVGPLIHRQAAGRLQDSVEEATARGADVLCGGEPRLLDDVLQGAFYAPTVLRSVPEEARLQHEEIFGPVALVASFSDLDEAVSRANATDYGLAAYVFTESLRSAMALAERLEAGMVVINQASASGVHAPQGGIKQSGIGLEGGSAGVDEFAYQKYVSIGL